jgi:hypothetical protein
LNALRIVVAVLVTAVWVAVYAASIVRPGFSAPPEVSGVMLAVVTYLFGRALREGLTKTIREKAQQVADALPEDPPDDPAADQA